MTRSFASLIRPFLVFGMLACASIASAQVDADGDGFETPIDCDDTNAAVYPGATEICDGLDNDCNGQVDEGFPQQYADNDGDGFGNLLQPLPCDTPGVANADDCDDNNPDIYPGSTTGFNCMGCSAADQQNLSQGLHVQNGVLNGPVWTTTLQCAFSCSGQLDPAESIICFNTCMQSSASLGAGCSECFLIYIMTLLDPGCNACEAAALADFQACTGLIDDDGDGHFFPADCDDQDPELNPGALEICDGIDNNCDGNVDDLPLFADADGDGFGDPAQPLPCGTPGGVENSSDCDDSSAAVNPIATEVCDGVDNDCDGQVDEGFERFADEDGDGYGDPLQPRACDGPGATNNLDCDDTNAAIYPEQGCSGCGFASQTILSQILHVESGTLAGPYLSVTLQCFNICNDPLDPVASEACTVACLQTELSIGASCSQCLSDYISVAFAFECNAQCRAEALAQFIACAGLVDFDNDGYFAPTDCDDRNAAIHPGATEVCDGADNDCDGLVDEAGGLFADSDGDGFGNPNVILACGVPGVTNDLDCDDSNPGRYPGGPVPCPDCLPADQAIILSDPNYFANAGCFPLCIGSQNLTSCFSDCLEGSLSIGADCADCMATYITCVYFSCTACLQDPYSAACNLCRTNSPCNDAYESCSGLIDNDGDGSYVLFDCDDNEPSVYPNAPELCDGLDNDCDGEIDEDNVCEVICTTDINLVFQTDGVSTINWEIRDQSTDLVVQSGNGLFPQSPGYGISTCLPDGCFRLAVFDDAGDGIVNGGYILSLTAGERLIDDRNNFTTGSISAMSGGQGFCLPISTDKVVFTSCDKLDWITGQYVVAAPNAAVSAEWVTGGANNVQDGSTGYEFWIFDPNGSYSFRRFRSHNVSDGFGPASATRACHMKLNNWTAASQVPANVLMNVRIRARVNGVNGEFGPACRMMIDPVRAACPGTNLMDIPGNQFYSCGSTRMWGANNYVHARPVSGANRYQFRFSIAAEGFEVVRQTTTYFVQLNWSASAAPQLQDGKTYDVDVRVSKDGGLTWCTSSDPWGNVCKLTIGSINVNANAAMTDGLRGSSSAGELIMFPNPNRGDQLFVSITTLPLDVHLVTLDLFNLTGKLVTSRVLAAQDGLLNTAVDLQGELGDGLYLVQFKAGASVWSQRLVIAR